MDLSKHSAETLECLQFLNDADRLEYLQFIEEKLLFMMVMDNDIIEWVKAHLDMLWLTKELNKITYKHILKVYEEFGEVNFVLLSESSSIDLVRHLKELGDVVSSAFYKSYTKALKKRHKDREKKLILRDGTNKHPIDIIQRLSNLSHEDDTAVNFSEVIKKVGEKIKARQGGRLEFPTGIDFLDTRIGLERGEVTTIGADTSTGKTSMLTSILQCFASFGKRILYVDLQMGQDGISKRIIKMLSGVEVYAPHVYHLTTEELQKVKKATEMVRDWKLFVREYPTCNDILSGISDLNPDIVIVDYIQQISIPGFRGNITAETEVIAKTLEKIAIQTNVVMILASQFARGVISKSIIPTIHSFKNSGAVENCCRIALLMYRKFIYDNQADPSIIELSIAKNSNGALGSGQLFFDTKTLQVRDYCERY